MFSFWRSGPWALVVLLMVVVSGLGFTLKHAWQDAARMAATRDQYRKALSQQEQVNAALQAQSRRNQQLLQDRAQVDRRLEQARAALTQQLRTAPDASTAYRHCRAVRLPDSSLRRLREQAGSIADRANDTAD